MSTVLLSSSRSSIDHSVSTNSAPRLGLLELPGHRLHAVGDEQVAKGPRLVVQPPLEQIHLVVERLDRLGPLQHLDLRTAALERAAGVEVALQVLRAGGLIMRAARVRCVIG